MLQTNSYCNFIKFWTKIILLKMFLRYHVFFIAMMGESLRFRSPDYIFYMFHGRFY